MKGCLLGGEKGANLACGLRTFGGVVHDFGPSAPVHDASAERRGLDRFGHLRQGRKSTHAIATPLLRIGGDADAVAGFGAVRPVGGRFGDDLETVLAGPRTGCPEARFQLQSDEGWTGGTSLRRATESARCGRPPACRIARALCQIRRAASCPAPFRDAGRFAQSAGFQMMAKASSSSCPAARPRLA